MKLTKLELPDAKYRRITEINQPFMIVAAHDPIVLHNPRIPLPEDPDAEVAHFMHHIVHNI